MGLEHQDAALIVQPFHRVQQSLQLAGMVGIIVIHIGAVVFALELEAAAGAVEACQAVLHRVGPHAQADGGGSGGQGVLHVVQPGHMEGHIGEQFPLEHNVKVGVGTQKLNILRIDIRLPAQAEGHDLAGDIPDGGHSAGIVQVGHHIAVLRGAQGKLPEGVLHILQVFEEIQMVGLHIQDHRHGGVEGQEGIVILTGLHNDGVAVAHPMPGVQQGQGAADHDGGVLIRGHHDVGAHGGGGGFAVGAGNAQGVAVVLGDGAPGLGPLKDRDAQRMGPDDLRVIVMDGGSAHHELNFPGDIFRLVADGHRDALLRQAHDVLVPVHVRAADCNAHAPKHVRQGGHGNTADADQVASSAR